MSDQTFLNGILVKEPRQGAPEFVKGHISIKREELINTLSQMDGEWVNLDIKEARSGKWYASVNDWKPDRQSGGGRQQSQRQGGQSRQQAPQQAPIDDFADDDIPF